MTELQPPGTGLPPLERLCLNGVFKMASAVVSDRQALQLFQRESEELRRLALEDDSYDAFEPYLIPRVIGIEDSSRHWSVAMVLEHLCLVNSEIQIAVESLSSGIVPRGEIDVSFYKPEVDLDDSVFDRFDAVNQKYVSAVENLLASKHRLPTHPTFPHPWFVRSMHTNGIYWPPCISESIDDKPRRLRRCWEELRS